MKAIDKITKRNHAYCPVLMGYQVCTTPDVKWEDADVTEICVFTIAQFNERFTPDLPDFNSPEAFFCEPD
jgi:hypothetical protein